MCEVPSAADCRQAMKSPSVMQLTWNTAFQHHILEKLWPEVEVNSTFSKGGEDNGDKQTFLTPGADTEKYQAARASAFTARSRGRKGRLKAVPKRGPQGRIARPTNAILTCQPARTRRFGRNMDL
jgi:hypothetical protein